MPQRSRHIPTSSKLRAFAKTMRHTPTDAEAAMWQLLCDRRFAHLKFRRQVPFQNYILDFACFEKRLILDIDGSQHASQSRDQIRDAALGEAGFRVLRYWNNDVLQRRNNVLEDILAKLAESDE